jgi:DnaJ-class molecular chaperone
MSLFRDFQTFRPSFGALWDRMQRNFTGVGVPKAERLEALNVEVVLTPEQALYGVEVPLGVPVFSTCPSCGGSGRQWLFPCLECGQEGYAEGEAVVRIDVPPGVRTGAVFEIPMTGLGIENLFLRLHIVVAA